MSNHNHVLYRKVHKIGILTLNRPSKLNALTLEMVRTLSSVLSTWRIDPGVVATVLEGCHHERTGRNVFCAGGDVVAIALDGLETAHEHANANAHGYGRPGLYSSDFIREEYRLNRAIGVDTATSTATPPQISLWDGVVMGGGVGLSVHGAYRVATEHTVFAMPETSIGFFPDVGTLYLFSRMELDDNDDDDENDPRERNRNGLGVFLGLTGWRLKPDDLMNAGIATHYVPSHRIDDLKESLVTNVECVDDVIQILDRYHDDSSLSTAPTSFLRQHEEQIQSIFGLRQTHFTLTLKDIFGRLETMDTDFTRDVLKHLRKVSPTSLAVTLEGIRRACHMDTISEVLQMEYRISQGFLRHRVNRDSPMLEKTDFYEGVRALLIDKDKNPKWNPQSIDDLDFVSLEKRFFTEGVLETELTFFDHSKI